MEPLAFPLAGLRKVLAGEMSGDGNDVDVRVRGLPDKIARLGVVGGVEKPFDAGGLVVVGKEALRDIGLLVEVHDQAATATLLADGRNEPAKVRLADAAFQIERRNDAGAAVGGGGHGQDGSIVAR